MLSWFVIIPCGCGVTGSSGSPSVFIGDWAGDIIHGGMYRRANPVFLKNDKEEALIGRRWSWRIRLST